MDSLEDLQKDGVRDIYDAEKPLTGAPPELIKKLRRVTWRRRSPLSNHLKETQEHIVRPEQVFERMQMPSRGKRGAARR
jgi:ferritin-like metal-binding protein YciE